MKKFFCMAIAFIGFSCSIQAQGDVPLDEEAMYFDIDDMPNAVIWLPAPPDTTSTKFVYDITQYMWGKTQRLDSIRAQQAIDNAVEEIDQMAEQFSVPFGMEITKEKTPAIFKVLYRGASTGSADIYNIQGQQLNKKPDKGVFIQSGRKYAGK